jgi:hypothetical protein
VDEDCGEGEFCDRVGCATVATAPMDYYGRPCEETGSFPPCVPNTVPCPTEPYFCGAYVCIDDRCRSCASDAECRTEGANNFCYPSEGRRGVRCGASLDPDE